jgi:spore maturation protein SpmB
MIETVDAISKGGIKEEIIATLHEATSVTITLFKIMIPLSIIVKILTIFGVVERIGDVLYPFMSLVGLPGESGLVWGTTMITNIYGGLIVFFTLSQTYPYTVAQVTVLATMMLVAHTLPVELRIAQRAGVRLWFMFALRVGCAFLLGYLLFFCFSLFSWYTEPATVLWNPGSVDASLFGWLTQQLRNYLMIFLIIISLLFLMRFLKKTGVIDKLNTLLEPGLEVLGISKQAAPLAIIGLTLGISYGGGLIIKETQSHLMNKKDAFLSVSMMGLSHSLIEDTLLMVAIGASLSGILVARIAFTIVIMLLLISIINRLPQTMFRKYLVNS